MITLDTKSLVSQKNSVSSDRADFDKLLKERESKVSSDAKFSGRLKVLQTDATDHDRDNKRHSGQYVFIDIPSSRFSKHELLTRKSVIPNKSVAAVLVQHGVGRTRIDVKQVSIPLDDVQQNINAASGVVTDLSVAVINKHPDFKADIAAVPVKLTSESTSLPSAITIESTVIDGDNLITAAPIKAAACLQITSSSQMFDNHLTQYAEVNAYVNTYRVFFRDKYFLFHFEGTKIMYYIEKNNDSH